MEKTNEKKKGDDSQKHDLQFYFDAYIRAMHGEPNFTEMEVT